MHRSDYHLHERLPSVSPEELRMAMRQLAAGVTVVTAEHDGTRFGITATSVTSIALEPPIVMVAINSASPLLDAVLASEHFAIHILDEGQQSLAERFAMPHPIDKYEGLQVQYASTGAPILPGSLASIDCAVAETITIGSHAVIFGRVIHAAFVPAAGRPLVYFHRSYRRLDPFDGESEHPS